MSTSKTVIAVILALAAVFSAVFLTVDYCHPQNGTVDPENKTETGYIIKEYKGKIAVFETHGTEPVYILDSPTVRDLPVYDRALLSMGISVDNAAELGSLIEDYDS